MEISTTRRTTTVALVITSILTLGLPRPARANVQRVALKSESQVKSEARLYDTAIQEIGRIESLALKTADEFNRAKSIIEQHVPNLRLVRSKLVVMALNDTTLISAARARTSTTKLAEELAVELATNSESVFKLSGGATVRDNMNRSYKNDTALLVRVSEKLKQAAAVFKGHHAGARSLPHASNVQRGTTVADAIGTVILASLIVSAVMIACPPLAIALPVLASLAFGTAYGVGLVLVSAVVIGRAAELVLRVAANVGTQEGRDKIATCLENVDASYDSCVRDQPLIASLGGCLADYLLRAAACLLVE